MGEPPAKQDKPETDKLSEESIQDLSIFDVEVIYRPIPHPDITAGKKGTRPVWRVRFDLASDPSKCFGLDINDEIILGRAVSEPNLVDLSDFNAIELGVSRRHAMIRPTGSKLFLIDLDSTNGTFRNGYPLGRNTPYSLSNGDTISLGRLQFVVRIIERPRAGTGELRAKADLAEALVQTAKAITSQLKLGEVLQQVAEVAMTLTSAGETTIWLIDEKSGELVIEAYQGIEDENIQHLRLPVSNSLVGKVIRTGKPLRASREPGGDKIKVKTDYLVESVLYVPIKLGGVTFGVLGAAHREAGKSFSARDERILETIGDFAAIAVQNARLYEATDEALARRVEELATLNELSHAVTSTLDLMRVHEILIEQLHRHWQIEAAALWLVDEKTQSIRSFSPAGSQNRETTHRVSRIGRGIIGWVARQGEPLLVEDVQKHPAYDPNVDTVADLEAHSMACVPLTVKDQVVGVLALFNSRGDPFGERDIERLSAFARPVATAIQNARLFAESERERATVHATANALSQPMLIIDDQGEVVIFNQPAQELLERHMARLFDGISEGVGRTIELTLGDKTFITTTEHSPDVGTIVVMQDITYVKKLEQAQAEFVNAFSHDLKGPLSSIKGWANLIEKAAPDIEKTVFFARRIVEASDRMAKMINQLLDIALLSEAPQSYHAPCNLVDITRRALSDAEGAALARSLILTFRQEGEPYLIQGDESRLYRSVLNLLDNAIKYSEEGEVLVRLKFDEEGVSVSVRDDGPGIPEEDLPHLFERYYRGKQTRGEKSGVGLGLVMVQATAKAHGGTVSVCNVEDHGAEFTIQLPSRLRIPG